MTVKSFLIRRTVKSKHAFRQSLLHNILSENKLNHQFEIIIFIIYTGTENKYNIYYDVSLEN